MAIDVSYFWKSSSPSPAAIGDFLEIQFSVNLDTLKGSVVKTSPRFEFENPESFFQSCEDHIREFLSFHMYSKSDLCDVTDEISFLIKEKFSPSSEDDSDDDGVADADADDDDFSAESVPGGAGEFCLFVSVGSEEELRERIKAKGCGVCLKEYYGDCGHDVAWMPCFHAFHRICIARWLVTDGSCPVCRVPLRESVAGKKEMLVRDEASPLDLWFTH